MAQPFDRLTRSLVSGAAGAVVLTVIHETARRVVPDPPRMDQLGRRGLRRGLRSLGLSVPSHEEQQEIALAGDLLTNGLTYALVGLGDPRTAPIRGGVMGGALGLMSLVGAPLLDLGPGPDRQKVRTQAMTVAWYAAGGLAAGLVYRALAGSTANANGRRTVQSVRRPG